MTDTASVPSGPRVRALLASRIVEQGALGLATLVLARVLGVDAFAPVSVLFVVNSIAVTGSDFGLGAAVLRHPSDRSIVASTLHRLRLANVGLTAAALIVAVLVSGDARAIVVASAFIWTLSAEAYVRKSVAIKIGRTTRVAAAEVASSTVFVVAVVAAAVNSTDALQIVAIGLCLKHLVEILAVPYGREVFGMEGDSAGLGPLWGTQMLAFGVSNVDYLVVGLMFPPAVFSVYVLGFRLANAIPAQVSSVATRLALVDLADGDVADRQLTYERYCRRLFLGGLAGAAATAAVAPVLPRFLGDSWQAVAWVVAVMAIAVPWRLTLGLAGAISLTSGLTGWLLRVEVVRLLVFAGVLLAVSNAGFGAVVAVVTIAEAVAVLVYHSAATKRSGLHRPAYLLAAGVATMVLTGVILATVPVPPIL